MSTLRYTDTEEESMTGLKTGEIWVKWVFSECICVIRRIGQKLSLNPRFLGRPVGMAAASVSVSIFGLVGLLSERSWTLLNSNRYKFCILFLRERDCYKWLWPFNFRLHFTINLKYLDKILYWHNVFFGERGHVTSGRGWNNKTSLYALFEWIRKNCWPCFARQSVYLSMVEYFDQLISTTHVESENAHSVLQRPTPEPSLIVKPKSEVLSPKSQSQDQKDLGWH